jgi:DNA-binding NarL/FixJ family response regulator
MPYDAPIKTVFATQEPGAETRGCGAMNSPHRKPAPQQNGANVPRRRIALIVREPAERQSLLKALDTEPRPEVFVLDHVQALNSTELGEMDAVVISHQALARFKGPDTLGFLKLCRGARVIIALTSDELLDASGTIGLADGWIFADLNPSHLLDVIELSKEGYSIMPEPVIERLTANKLRLAEYERLPELERRVIDLISEGCGNQEIADRLGLSAAHIKALVKSGLARLHFQNRTQAAVFIARQLKGEAKAAS